MSQKLIQAVNHMKLTASWQTEAYRLRFGCRHYGVDCVSAAGDTTVYASGDGTVLTVGYDSVFGNVVVIRYPDAYNRVANVSRDLVVRCFHFAATAVVKGQRVNKDTVIGRYGATGKYVSGAHLHLEVDTDVAYPLWTPTLSGSSTYFTGSAAGAVAGTMSNPLEWIHCKAGAPDNQTYCTTGDSYIRTEDRSIARIA